MVIWITGLPGAGKTTIATLLYQNLIERGKQVVLLDGDSLRQALQSQNYDKVSRLQLAKTYSRLANMFSEQGQIAICATVSMFHEIRRCNREVIENYFEIYLKVTQPVLQSRDQKSLYSGALKEIKSNVYGFDIDIEEPECPDLIIDNDSSKTPENIVTSILEKIT